MIPGIENENNIAESNFITVTSFYSESVEKYSVDWAEAFIPANTLQPYVLATGRVSSNNQVVGKIAVITINFDNFNVLPSSAYVNVNFNNN